MMASAGSIAAPAMSVRRVVVVIIKTSKGV
jgi:hypothetical protein